MGSSCHNLTAPSTVGIDGGYAPKMGPYISMSFSSLLRTNGVVLQPPGYLLVRSKPRSTVARNSPQSMSPSTFTSLRLTALCPFRLKRQRHAHARLKLLGHDLKFHVFDGDVLREPASIYGEPLYLCSNDGGCSLVGSQVHLSFPAEMFTSDSATVEVTGPDDTTIQTAFDLVALR